MITSLSFFNIKSNTKLSKLKLLLKSAFDNTFENKKCMKQIEENFRFKPFLTIFAHQVIS